MQWPHDGGHDMTGVTTEQVTVTAVRTYPRTGEPALEHAEVEVAASGLAGDRAKKAPVSLIGNDSPDTRANLVLDVPSARVEALVGHLVQVGDVVLALVSPAGRCPGAYAEVWTAGTITVGDAVRVVPGEDTDE